MSLDQGHYRAVERNIYKTIQKEFSALNASTISAGTVVQSLPLLNNKTKYVFDFNKTTGTDILDRPLNENDIIAATQISVFLQRREIANPHRSVYYTFPNPNVFPTPEAEDLESIYNGVLNIEVNQKKYVEDLTLHRFRRVQQTHYVDSTGAGATARFSSYEFGDGMTHPTPFIKLRGFDKKAFNIEIPLAAGAVIEAAAAGFENRLVVILDGFRGTGVRRN